MEVRKRFENDKLKKLQIFNGAQLKYIAFQFIAILGADECLLPVGASVLFPTNYYLSIPFFENFFHLTFFV